MRKNHRTYHPTKAFDDKLDGLVKLFKAKKWSFTNVDLKTLEKDAVAQRVERAQFDAAQRQFAHTRESFAAAQAQRHRRYASALGAAEGAFKDDPAVLSELEQFKGPGRGKKSKKPAPPTGKLAA